MQPPTKETLLKDAKGRHFPLRSWIPKGATTQVTIVHGYAQHISCYHHWIEILNKKKIAVHIFDLLGHGESEGIRGHIYNFQEFINILKDVTKNNPHKVKNKPQFLFGHSMGGTIASHYMLQEPNDYKGLILSSPLIGFHFPQSVWGKVIAQWFQKKSPSLPIPKPPGNKSLSRDPKSLDAYVRDPLRLRVITPNLYLQMVDWTHDLQNNAPRITCPTLIFMSEQDQVVSDEKITRFFKDLSVVDKKLVVFGLSQHEILNEPEEAQLTRVMLQWMKERH